MQTLLIFALYLQEFVVFMSWLPSSNRSSALTMNDSLFLEFESRVFLWIKSIGPFTVILCSLVTWKQQKLLGLLLWHNAIQSKLLTIASRLGIERSFCYILYINTLQDKSIPFRDIDWNPSKKSLTSVRQYSEIRNIKHFKKILTLT